MTPPDRCEPDGTSLAEGESTPDTIVAVASPLGAAPRAICRLSGPDALSLACGLFHPSTDAARTSPGRAPVPGPRGTGFGRSAADTYFAVEGAVGLALRPDGSPSTVPATLYVMRAPRSYTREDVVEFHVPGAPPIVAELVRALTAAGARPARPGEFTLRAFFNGRIDLAQAEAVLGLIRAADDEEARSALAGLGGAISRRIRALVEQLAQLAALVELGIDFSEEDLDPIAPEVLAARLAATASDLRGLAAEPVTAAALDAAAVAFVGPANSGKSSLFNALVGHARSIVSHVPGTTRDVVTAPLVVGLWHLTLADTAGGGVEEDGLASAAWAAAVAAAGASHLRLVVLDGSEPLTDRVRALVGSLAGTGPQVIVLNKRDLPPRLLSGEVAAWRPGVPVVETSAVTGAGLEHLRQTIAGAFAEGRVRVGSQGLLLPARQARAVAAALEALGRASSLLAQGDRPELAAFELRAAREALDLILGSGLTAAGGAEDLLDRIFSQFCIGK